MNKFFGVDAEKPSLHFLLSTLNSLIITKGPISNTFGRNPPAQNPSPYQENKRAVSLDRREVAYDQGGPRFHRKNIFHNDVYAVTKTNNYNPVTCQILGDPALNQEDNYVTTNNKNYGNAGNNKVVENSLYERKIEEKYMPQTRNYPENGDAKMGGKRIFDKQRNEFNPINLDGGGPMVVNTGKKQFCDRGKADINVLNGQINVPEDALQREMGKRKFAEKSKADFNLISGQRYDEGRFVSAKQEYHMDKKGEDLIKKRLMENSNNLLDQFAGTFSRFKCIKGGNFR